MRVYLVSTALCSVYRDAHSRVAVWRGTWRTQWESNQPMSHSPLHYKRVLGHSVHADLARAPLTACGRPR